MPYDRASANRTFAYAVLASLALHALLLLLDFPRELFNRPVELLAPIIARLVEPPAPPPAAPVAEPADEKLPQAVAPKPKPRPAAKPAPTPAPLAEPAPARIPEPSPPAAAPAPAPAPLPAPVAKAVPAPQPGPGVPDTAATIDQYRAALLDEARRHKRYPPVALDNGWVGEVVVRMAIGADGSLAGLSVKSSSGHVVLDRQALEMFRKAKPQVPLPQALRGKPFALELRAVFNLEDQTSG